MMWMTIGVSTLMPPKTRVSTSSHGEQHPADGNVFGRTHTCTSSLLDPSMITEGATNLLSFQVLRFKKRYHSMHAYQATGFVRSRQNCFSSSLSI
jgi:hypothetical protein